MAFNPALTTPTDRVRFAVQDTDDSAALLDEATYTALLGLYADSEGRATVAAAEALLTRYAQQPDEVEVTGAVKVKWTQRIAAWRALANGLRSDLGLTPVGASGADSTLRIGQFTRGAATSEYGG